MALETSESLPQWYCESHQDFGRRLDEISAEIISVDLSSTRLDFLNEELSKLFSSECMDCEVCNEIQGGEVNRLSETIEGARVLVQTANNVGDVVGQPIFAFH